MDQAERQGNSYITIVAGLPRSGTSMMMQLLVAGGMSVATDGVRCADQSNPRGYFELEVVKQLRSSASWSWLEQLHGQAVKMVHLLLYYLPEGFSYRVIFMRRNLEEVVVSQREMLERSGTVEVIPHAQLVALFEQEVKYLERWLEMHPDIQTLHVDYNQIILDPHPWIHMINQFLGGHLDTDYMLKVIDQSLYRCRR